MNIKYKKKMHSLIESNSLNALKQNHDYKDVCILLET